MLSSKPKNTQYESVWTLTVSTCADLKYQVYVKCNRSHKATDQQTERSILSYLLSTVV